MPVHSKNPLTTADWVAIVYIIVTVSVVAVVLLAGYTGSSTPDQGPAVAQTVAPVDKSHPAYDIVCWDAMGNRIFISYADRDSTVITNGIIRYTHDGEQRILMGSCLLTEVPHRKSIMQP